MVFTLGVGVAAAAVPTPDAEVLLVLFDTAPAAARPALEAAGREALSAARVAAFDAAGHAARLRALLPAGAGDGLDCLAVLAACLVTLPAAAAADLERRLAAQSAIAYVARFPAHSDWRADPASADAGQPRRPATAHPVLALFDNGADLTHPLFAEILGPTYFRPGTPGVARDGRLLRSHGTAMLGIYAGLARGDGLVASGLAQAGFRGLQPLAYGATLVARAGPETAAGQAELVRLLAWLLAPRGVHPWPDVLNYSQGNGSLCGATPCEGHTWHGVTRLLDRAIDEYGITVVKSAGNGGDGAGTTMTVPGDTWNGITVGNMHAVDTASCRPSDVRARHRVYRTSSVAATVGPRLLDIVAPGVRVATAGVDPAWCRVRCSRRGGPACTFCRRLGRPGSGRDGYWKTNTGTSPAAAVVGAVAARLIARGHADARLVRAILVNSATSWGSSGRPHPTVRGDGSDCAGSGDPGHGPHRRGAHYDRSYGYGYLDARRALAEARHARLDVLAPASAACYRVELPAWGKLTLAWSRRVGRCTGCAGDGFQRASPLTLALYAEGAGHVLVDADDDSAHGGNLLQVSNGRDARAPVGGALVARVATTARQFDGLPGQLEPFALASARPLARLPRCPLDLADPATVRPRPGGRP